MSATGRWVRIFAVALAAGAAGFGVILLARHQGAPQWASALAGYCVVIGIERVVKSTSWWSRL